MSLVSKAQLNVGDLGDLSVETLLDLPNGEFLSDKPADEVMLEIEEPKGEKLDLEEPEAEIVFALPKIPGADDQSDIEVIESDDQEVPESMEVVEHDPWNWQSKGMDKFIDWIQERLTDIPKHTGKDTTGLEKAISYFEAVDREISKAMRQDYKNEIDSSKAEEARAEIESGLERLTERLNKVRGSKFKRHQKKNKKADVDGGLVKEAQKITGVSGIVVTVPLLISRCARVCINGTISAGHDMEDMYDQQVKLYKLSMREQAELQQILEDMGYPMFRDRGIAPDKAAIMADEDNFDWQQNTPG